VQPEIDLKLLRLLTQIHALGSVSRAAEAVHLSQPATSLALGRLRRILGDPLFVRGTGGMLPTPRCNEVVATAQEALSLIDKAVLNAPAFDPLTARRDFVVTLSDIGEVVFLPKLMAELSRLAPHCNLRSRALSARELPQAMESGQVEMAIGFFPDLERPGFFMQKLFEHRFVCLVREGHPRVKADKISLAVFLDLPHAVVEPEGRSHELFERLLKDKGLTRRVQLNIPHFMSVPAIVAATDMIVTVPRAVAEYFVRFGEVRIVQPPINTQRYALKQHWHERFNADPALKWLRGVVARTFVE
jgi:DNA-binding transcriptional LysR family regulator